MLRVLAILSTFAPLSFGAPLASLARRRGGPRQGAGGARDHSGRGRRRRRVAARLIPSGRAHRRRSCPRRPRSRRSYGSFLAWSASRMTAGCIAQFLRLIGETLTAMADIVSTAPRCHDGSHARPTRRAGLDDKAANWIDELVRHVERLQQTTSRLFVAMLGGGVGNPSTAPAPHACGAACGRTLLIEHSPLHPGAIRQRRVPRVAHPSSIVPAMGATTELGLPRPESMGQCGSQFSFSTRSNTLERATPRMARSYGEGKPGLMSRRA